ncbi:MAG TPA: DUF4124 domain-containing protein [Woeseiaceae bacterium]|nr:DUF4124 domain-containing protein [Woeseiaceae bacterium]
MRRATGRTITPAACLALMGALLAASAPATAYEIYKWTDEDGVVHYGDERPQSAPSPVETLHVPETNSPDYDPAEARRAAIAEAGRIREALAARREARAAEEAQARALEAEARLAELERRVAAAEEAAYARAIRLPFAFVPRHHGPFPPHREHRPPRDVHRLPPGDRSGWPGPVEPAEPAAPGFRAPDPR